MTMELTEQQKNEIAGKVLMMLSKQKFADWYEKDFVEYIEASNSDLEKKMLEDIKKKLRL